MKIILDTDIGTDVDDLMALALIVASPELDLIGVTTAYGDTRLRAKIVHRVLELAGRLDVPIHAGQRLTLNGERPIFWPGHEGKNAGVESIPDTVITPGLAEDFLLETLARYPGEVTILAVAPLGNLARAILKAPATFRLAERIVMMGGVFGNENLEFGGPEHNIRCDPEAARVVFGSGVPVSLFPLDVTTKVELHRADVDEIGRGDHPLARFLHAELATWLAYVKEHLHGRDYTHMHDPLVTASLLEPELVTRWVRTRVAVECSGEFTTGATVPRKDAPGGEVEVAMGVDAARFRSLFLSRVTASSAAAGVA